MIDRSKLQMVLKRQSNDSLGTLRKSPLIEIVGRSRVIIENHNGVCEYETNMIIIRVVDGKICVHGDGLKLKHMSDEVLVITGVITSIALQGR